jgi:hypothetical protein
MMDIGQNSHSGLLKHPKTPPAAGLLTAVVVAVAVVLGGHEVQAGATALQESGWNRGEFRLR